MTCLQRAAAALLLFSLVACQAPDSAGNLDTMSVGSAATDERAPNLVIILADDLGYGDLGIYGSEIIRTPNIDALARGGTRFTSGYVAAAVCSPSRAALMSGRHPSRLGYEFNPRDDNYALPLEHPTLASRLKEVGYATGIAGKWHLGTKLEDLPLQRGFDEFFGLMAATIFIEPDTPGVESWMPAGSVNSTRERPVFRGNEVVEEKQYLTEVLTGEALDFIQNHRNEPFFLYLSYFTPHVPLQATKKYLDRYRHIREDNKRIYAAMVSALDDGVGEVMAKLEELGLVENTLVAFLSDNGCALYTRGACSNGPLAGGKRYFWEGGVRVPFILSWPGAIPAGANYDEPVISMDVHVTMLDAAGVASDELDLDGVNLLPYLNDPGLGTPHRQLFWRAGPNHAIREGDWKLWTVNKTTREALASIEVVDGLRADFEAPKDSPLGQLQLLYDLGTDLGEQKALGASQREVLERLEAAWSEWNVHNREPMWNSNRGTVREIDSVPAEVIF